MIQGNKTLAVQGYLAHKKRAFWKQRKIDEGVYTWSSLRSSRMSLGGWGVGLEVSSFGVRDSVFQGLGLW